ncbi:MAG: response regulator [Proteobacteria bacterium]|nr:response regulator [Pseudomonadota bacterium]
MVEKPVKHCTKNAHAIKAGYKSELMPGLARARDIIGPKAARVELETKSENQLIETSKCPENQTHSTKASINILFVDDELMVARMGKRTLSRLGYNVTAITDSREALRLFKDTPYKFDLIITDETMPKLTGVGLARKMLAIRPDLPIILTTGYSEDLDEDNTKAMGIQGYTRKPIEIQTLAKIIDHLVTNNESAKD